LKKKKQKNFDSAPRHVAPALPQTREAEQMFFGSFFQKRTACFLLNSAASRMTPWNGSPAEPPPKRAITSALPTVLTPRNGLLKNAVKK
jgi:hypothetical protein